MLDPIQGFVISVGVLCGIAGCAIAVWAMVRIDRHCDELAALRGRVNDLERDEPPFTFTRN